MPPSVSRLSTRDTVAKPASSEAKSSIHNRGKSRSLSPSEFPTVVKVKNDSMLQTQLDLTHSTGHSGLIQELIERKTSSIAKFERMVATPTVVESMGVGSIVTQSLNARKWGSIRKVTARGEIVQRIKCFTKTAQTPHRGDLSSALLLCLPSDNSANFSPWFRLLQTLEAMDAETESEGVRSFSEDSDVKTAVFTVENVKQRIEKISDDEKIELEAKDVLGILEELTRAYRLLVKKVEDSSLLTGFDLIWQANCALFDFFVSMNSQKVAKVYSDIQKQVEKEQTRLQSSLQSMSEQWQQRLEEERKQTAKAAQVIDRLQQEKAVVLDLLKDRETEISEIRYPHEMRDFEVIVGDLGQYLEDMESRHDAQSQLLESISEMLNMRNLRKHMKRKDEIGYALIKQVLTGAKTEFGLAGRPRSGTANPAYWGRSRAFSTPHNLPRTRAGTLVKHQQPAGSAPHLHLPIPPIPEAPLFATDGPKGEGELDSSTDSEETTDDIGVQTDPWQPQQPPTVLSVLPKKPRRPKRRSGLLALVTDEMKKQPPMLNSNVFKLFEIAMYEKLRSDISEEEQGRAPKSMADFMLDFLFMQQGLKTLVVKSLGALLNALEVLAAKKHPYGTLFCRVLNVFVDRPFDHQLNSFLVKARAEFAELQKGYKTKPAKSEAEFGGSALLVDVSEKLISLFPGNKALAYEVVERLDLGAFTEFDKSCMIFCGRLNKVGRDFKIFFIQADPQKSGILDDAAFVTCAQDSFDVCLSRTRLLDVYRFLTSTKLRFADTQKLPFKDWVSKSQSKAAAITKCCFLTTIAEVYWSEEEKLKEKLRRTFDRRSREGVKNLLDFQDLVSEMEEGVPAEVVVQLYREALDLYSSENQDFVTRDAFCEIGLKYRLGCEGLRAFSYGMSPLQYALQLESTQTQFVEDPESP